MASPLDEYLRLVTELGCHVGPDEVDETLATLDASADLIEAGIEEALASGLRGVGAQELLTIVDLSSSLLYRTLKVQRSGEYDALVFGIPFPIEEFLAQRPDTALCYLLMTRDGAVHSLWAHRRRRDSPVRYGQGVVVLPESGAEFRARLHGYAASLASGEPDFEALEAILDALGSGLAPCFLGGEPPPASVIFLTGGLLHVVPLHAISFRHERRGRIYLDEMLGSVSYLSSLFEMFGLVAEARPPKKLLAVFDAEAAELEWMRIERAYYEELGSSYSVDVVDRVEDLPPGLEDYLFLSWSGHARSTTNSWGGSLLELGGQQISARTIADSWLLNPAACVLLAACETSVDLSVTGGADEYCGLDLAFKIAGASTVCSAMWPVDDVIAAIGNLVITSHLLQGSTPEFAALRFQSFVRTGHWREYVRRMAPPADAPAELARAFSEAREAVLAEGTDAPPHISEWAAFRCHGYQLARHHREAREWLSRASAEHRARSQTTRGAGAGVADSGEPLSATAARLLKRGRYAEAEALYRALLAHPETSAVSSRLQVALNNLTICLLRLEKHGEAEHACRRLLELETSDPDLSPSAGTLGNLAEALLGLERYVEAEPLFEQALSLDRQEFGDRHPYVARHLHHLGKLHLRQGDLERAETLLREALAIRDAKLPAGHADIAFSLKALAGVLWSQQRHSAAEPLLRRLLDLLRDHPDAPLRAQAAAALAQSLAAQGRAAEAEEILASFPEAAELPSADADADAERQE